MLGAVACSDDEDPSTGAGTETGNGMQDMGPADTGDNGDLGPAEMGTPDSGTPDGPCFQNITDGLENGCPSGQVCNLASGECVEGTACTDNSDCARCSDEPSQALDCGHGANVASYCSADHGNVCVRSKTNCEPCQTDADCGIMDTTRLGFLTSDQRQIRCVEYDDGNRYCATTSVGIQCPLGYEANEDRRCVNPQGCEDTFLCSVFDAEDDPETPEYEGDGEADINPDCNRPLQTQCFNTVCENSGGQRCTGFGIPGTVEVCADYCRTDQECVDQNPALPFCERSTGLCRSGCTPGECGNNLVCHADGECRAACEDDADCEGDDIVEGGIQDPDGIGTYCNIDNGRPLPRKFKGYHDSRSCQQLGCELGPDEMINRDCEVNQACDPFAAPFPDCVEGCYRGLVEGGDCQVEPPFDFGKSAVCVDANAGEVTTRESCRDQPFFGGDNREVIGTCCDAGCLSRTLQCSQNRFCCGEFDSTQFGDGVKMPRGPYGNPAECTLVTADQPASGQATPGQCFQPPNTPFCRTCDPALANSPAPCNLFPLTNLVPNPNEPLPNGDDPPNQDMYVHSNDWPYGLNTRTADTMQVNSGNPFPELQVCTGVQFDMAGNAVQAVCSVSFDPAKSDPGCPSGWEFGARTAPCFSDADCGGLTCVGEDTSDPMMPIPGACRCGEGGQQTDACPTAVGDLDMGDSGRMRCVSQDDDPYLNVGGRPGDLAMEGDFFCVYTYDCRPPLVGMPGDDILVYPQTCGIQETP